MGERNKERKKRKQGHAEKDGGSSKKSKTSDDFDDFTVVHFKHLLQDPNTTFSALEKFTNTIKQWTPGTGFNLAKKYCQSSPDCSEIFKVLEAEKRKQAEIQCIFAALECLLLRIVEEGEKLASVGNNMVQRLLASHMGKIYHSLQMTNKSSQIKITLKLLVAMVMLGDQSARAILTQFDFTHRVIPPLFNRRDKRDPQDVRTCAIHFAMAFMLTGSDGVIKQLMENKGFVSSTFEGLSSDNAQTIQLVLNTLLEKIILNPVITKTQKVQLLSDSSLKHIAQLYQWEGPLTWQGKADDSIQVPVEERSEDQSLVIEATHKLLLELCCSNKNGINFFDKALGTGKNQNHILTGLLTSLTKVKETPEIQELIVKTLRTCPDQIRHFLPTLLNSLTPRPSSKWIAAVQLLKKIYEGQADRPAVLKLKERVPVTRFCDMLMVGVLPTAQVLYTVLQALKHKHLTVRHTVLDFIYSLLRRIQSTVEHVKSDDGLKALFSDTDIAEIITKFTENVTKAMPDTQVLFTCWDKLTSTTEEKSENDSSGQQDIDLVSKTDHMIKLEQVLCLYQELLPFTLDDNPNDINRLLEGVKRMSEGSPETGDMLPQLYLLKLLSGTDARKLPWGKENADGHSLMYLLFEMLTRSNSYSNTLLSDTTSALICQLLHSTGLFEHSTEELQIWIKYLRMETKDTESPEEKSVYIKFLTKIFTTFIANPYPYVDRVGDFVYETVTMATDEEEDMDVDIMEQIEKDTTSNEEIEVKADEVAESCGVGEEVSNHDRFPFSPLIVIALENLDQCEEHSKKCLSNLVSKTLLDIFHLQLQPLAMVYMLKGCHRDNLHPGILNYVLKWDPNSQIAMKSKSVSQDLPCALTKELMELYGGSEGTDTTQGLVELFSDATPEDKCLAAKQVLLYIGSVVTKRNKNEKGVSKVFRNDLKKMETLFSVLSKFIHFFTEEESSETAQNNDDSAETDDKQKLLMELCQSSQGQISRSQCLFQIMHSVFSHPVLLQWFLYDDAHDAWESDCKTRDMSVAVTSQMCEIFSSVSEVDLSRLKTVLAKYITKINTNLKAISSSPGVEGHLLAKVTHVQQCLSVLSNYLDSSEHANLLHTILNLPSSCISTSDDHNNQDLLSPIGKLLTSLIRNLLVSCHGDELPLSYEDVGILFSLMVQCDQVPLSEVCSQILCDYTQYSVAIDNTIVDFLLKSSLPCAGKMLAVVIQQNSVARGNFEAWVVADNLKEERKQLLLEVVIMYLQCQLKRNGSMSKVTLKFAEIFTTDFQGLPNIESIEKTCGLLCVLLKLKSCSMEMQTTVCGNLLSAARQKSSLKKAHLELLVHLSHGEGAVLTRRELYRVLRDCTVYMTKDGSDEERTDVLLDCLCQFNETELKEFPEEVSHDFMSFIKSCLKFLFSDKRTFHILCSAVRIISDLDATFDLSMVCDMTMSHSMFLPVMFQEKHPGVRGGLVEFLLTLVELCPSCCTGQHIGLYLGSYGATLSDTDQKLLKLIHLYEKNEVKLTDYRPYLWGPKAIEHHSVKKTLGMSLWKQPSTDIVMDTLDPEKMRISVLKFPLLRKLQPELVQTAEECMSEEDLYDPCFLLPFFSNLLSPDAVIDCRMFVERNCLGYTMAALSSRDSVMRGAAYHVLCSYLHHLEGARFHEQQQMLYLVQLLQNSVDKPNTKLPCIITAFLARVTQLLLKPEEHMYQIINSFLLLKPCLDVGNVPEFYKLFNSSSLEFKSERSWILSLFVDGLREAQDFQIFEKRYVFKLLLSYFDSALSDKHSELQVLRLIRCACSDRSTGHRLVKHHGILSWLLGVISQTRKDDVTRFEIVTEILHVLWISLNKVKVQSKGQPADKSVPFTITKEMYTCLMAILRQYSENTESKVYEQFLETLVSVLNSLENDVKNVQADPKIDGVEPGPSPLDVDIGLSPQDVCLVLNNSARYTKTLGVTQYCSTALQAFKMKGLESSMGGHSKTLNNEQNEINLKSSTEKTEKFPEENSESLATNSETVKDKSENIAVLSVRVLLSWNALPFLQTYNNMSVTVTCSVLVSSASYLMSLTSLLPQKTVSGVVKWLHQQFCSKDFPQSCKLSGKMTAVHSETHGFMSGILKCYNQTFKVNNYKEMFKEDSDTKVTKVTIDCRPVDLVENARMLNDVISQVSVKLLEDPDYGHWKAFFSDLKKQDVTPEDLSCQVRQFCLGSESLDQKHGKLLTTGTPKSLKTGTPKSQIRGKKSLKQLKQLKNSKKY